MCTTRSIADDSCSRIASSGSATSLINTMVSKRRSASGRRVPCDMSTASPRGRCSSLGPCRVPHRPAPRRRWTRVRPHARRRDDGRLRRGRRHSRGAPSRRTTCSPGRRNSAASSTGHLFSIRDAGRECVEQRGVRSRRSRRCCSVADGPLEQVSHVARERARERDRLGTKRRIACRCHSERRGTNHVDARLSGNRASTTGLVRSTRPERCHDPCLFSP